MADFLSSLVQDPKRLEALSQFLLGFGRSAAVAGQRGFSTAGGLAVGFGAGGDALIQTGVRQQLADLREQEIKQREAQLAEQGKNKAFLQDPGITSRQVIDPGVAGAPRAQAAQNAAAARAGGADFALNIAQRAGQAGVSPSVGFGLLSSAIGQQGQQQRFEQGIEARKEAAAAAVASAKDLAEFKSGLPAKTTPSEFTKLQSQQTALERARDIALANGDPVETIERQIKRTSDRIDKLSTTVGRTEQDVASKTAQREGAKIASERRDEFERQTTDVVNLFRRGNEVVNTLEQGGGSSIVGFAGAFNRLGNAINEQSKALASQFGLSREVKEFDFQTFPKEAQNSAIIKSAMLDLAILKAGATGAGTGRALSDKDVQQQLNSLGQGSGSARTFAGTLTEALRQVGLDVQTRRRTLIPGDENFDIFGFAKGAGVDTSRFGTGRFQGQQDFEFDPATGGFR